MILDISWCIYVIRVKPHEKKNYIINFVLNILNTYLFLLIQFSYIYFVNIVPMQYFSFKIYFELEITCTF